MRITLFCVDSSWLDCVIQHYLSYLNGLRIGDYCSTLDSLYHYYDRCSSLTGSVGPQNKLTDEDVASRSYRFAALGLAATHFRFGHRLVHIQIQ